MDKIKSFLNEWGNLILAVVCLMLMFATCNNKNATKSLRKEVIKQEREIDSLSKSQANLATYDQIMELYGLKTSINDKDKANAELTAKTNAQQETIQNQQSTINGQQQTIKGQQKTIDDLKNK